MNTYIYHWLEARFFRVIETYPNDGVYLVSVYDDRNGDQFAIVRTSVMYYEYPQPEEVYRMPLINPITRAINQEGLPL